LIFAAVSFTRLRMQIYVGKNGQQLGPFSLEEVNRKLADGTFAGSDLAWYEGAAGWAPLSGVAGVVIPAAAPAAPSPTPASTPSQAAVPIAPVRPNVPIVQPPAGGTRTLALVSWILLSLTFIVSLIPFVGCGAWVLGAPVAVAAIVMGIIILTRGRALQGALTILAGLLIVPLCFAGQFLSLAVFGGTIERKQTTQIIENLHTIDSAKTKWASETKAGDGAPVMMASLTSQLGGKEVKPIVGETYDPMPVGQPPTATLPANKTLGKFSGGDVMTIATLEKALADSSALTWNIKRMTSTSATPAPQSSPKPTPAPSVTASPRPSASPSPRFSPSPKSSSSPHSLISPRQSVEPEDSPSSRPSPSAKFGPRTTPRRSVPPSDEKSDSESSGGLKQGRKKPRESPDSTPEKSPDEEDE
jgi:hypothetical protein